VTINTLAQQYQVSWGTIRKILQGKRCDDPAQSVIPFTD
jgi:hypothetical protein